MAYRAGRGEAPPGLRGCLIAVSCCRGRPHCPTPADRHPPRASILQRIACQHRSLLRQNMASLRHSLQLSCDVNTEASSNLVAGKVAEKPDPGFPVPINPCRSSDSVPDRSLGARGSLDISWVNFSTILPWFWTHKACSWERACLPASGS